jgi:hypothetical protein
MKSRKSWKPRALAWLRGVAFAVLGLGMASPLVLGQESSPIPKSYLNKGTIHLPIQIDERVRSTVKEVQLFVKEGPQSAWVMKERVPGTQNYFTFRTTRDGEYWFNVVTVDKAGKAVPADVTKEPPGLIIVIDSTPPQTDAQKLAATPDGQPVHCEIHDANPDPAKTRFYFQTRDQVWRALEPVGGKGDIYCIPGQAAITGMVRLVAFDLAGNNTTREFSLATMQASASPVPADLRITGEVPGEKISIVQSIPTVAPPMQFTENVEVLVNKTAPPPLPPLPTLDPANKAPFAAPIISENRPTTERSPLAAPTEVLAKRHLVNNPHVVLDYQIEQAGVSGVGRVEIWCTRDMGQSWQRLGEDNQRKGQAEVELPGEGLFGVTIVVANGRGFGANPPQAGEAPDWWIEVDATKPRAELLSVRTSPSGEDSALHITWSAQDKNLAAEPIDLYYAVNRQGPWTLIAKGLKNDGVYRWAPGADVGGQAYIRLTVTDLAGNSASSETIQPVPLDDMSRPRGRLVGINTAPRSNVGAGPGAFTPQGN